MPHPLRLAYDGKGNFVARSVEDLERGVAALGGYAQGLYVERWAAFVKEVAVMVVRSRWGAAGPWCTPSYAAGHMCLRLPASLRCRVLGRPSCPRLRSICFLGVLHGLPQAAASL